MKKKLILGLTILLGFGLVSCDSDKISSSHSSSSKSSSSSLTSSSDSLSDFDSNTSEIIVP